MGERILSEGDQCCTQNTSLKRILFGIGVTLAHKLLAHFSKSSELSLHKALLVLGDHVHMTYFPWSWSRAWVLLSVLPSKDIEGQPSFPHPLRNKMDVF